MSDEHDDLEVVFEFEDLDAETRAELIQRLRSAGIAHEWDGGDLVVAEEVADRVDALIDELEADLEDEDDDFDVDEDDEDEDGEVDDAGYEVLAELFDVTDRLSHDPDNDGIAGDFELVAASIDTVEPPYGLAAEEWRRITEMTSGVRELVANQAGGEVVAGDAKVLREALRRYV